MVRIASAIALLAITSQTAAFVPATQRPIAHQLLATANDDTDFDAPVLKNPVMASSPMELDHEILIVDDECYLGKYGQHPECVDFGKIHRRTIKDLVFCR